MLDTLERWIPIIIALIGAISGLVAIWRQIQRDKQEFEESKKQHNLDITESAMQVVDRLERQITLLDGRVATLVKENEQLRANQKTMSDELEEFKKRDKEFRRGIQLLVSQICELGHEPRWKPM